MIHYPSLIQVLKDADNAGLFDLKTSQLAKIDSKYRHVICNFIKQYDNDVKEKARQSKAKCPDCGLLASSPQCCQNDQELWK
jgi:hypothetical protein